MHAALQLGTTFNMNPGLVIGIALSVSLGICGGAIGTYFSIKNTFGPRERAFMIRISIVTWIAVSIFVAALMLLPKPYNFLLWIPYGIALPLAIIRWNRKQLEIRDQESGRS
jgi:hypothetical protein